MKMSTRCPACGTAFRLYPEQLVARDGQVRCGRCSAIFDARSTLVTEDEPEPLPADAPLQAPGPAAAPPPRSEELAQGEPMVSQRVAPSEHAELEISMSDDDSDFEFGLQARRRSRIVAALWGLGVAVMAVVLGGQAAYAYRGELVLAFPESRPWIAAACARLGCTIPLPRHADLISIESSELAAERAAPGVLTLSAALRNRAGFAFPHLELTLTDAADRPLVRRVLAPAEYLGARIDPASAFAAGAEQPVRLHIDADGLNASGYRVFLFHRQTQ
jgi:predicted Zn finger-like uncharacterized protein